MALYPAQGPAPDTAPEGIDSIEANSGAASAMRSVAGPSPFEFVELDLGRVLRREARRALELQDERVERAVAVIGRALIAQPRLRVAATSVASRAANRDLPMPASPEINTIWPDRPRPCAGVRKFGALRLPPDEAGEPAACAASKRLSLSATPTPRKPRPARQSP